MVVPRVHGVETNSRTVDRCNGLPVSPCNYGCGSNPAAVRVSSSRFVDQCRGVWRPAKQWPSMLHHAAQGLSS